MLSANNNDICGCRIVIIDYLVVYTMRPIKEFERLSIAQNRSANFIAPLGVNNSQRSQRILMK